MSHTEPHLPRNSPGTFSTSWLCWYMGRLPMARRGHGLVRDEQNILRSFANSIHLILITLILLVLRIINQQCFLFWVRLWKYKPLILTQNILRRAITHTYMYVYGQFHIVTAWHLTFFFTSSKSSQPINCCLAIVFYQHLHQFFSNLCPPERTKSK